MKRALIASTVVLAAVLAFLVFQRLTARPPPPPAAAAATEAAAPVAHAEPTHAEAGKPTEPAAGHPPAEPKPAEHPPAEPRPAEPPAAHAAAAEPPPAAPAPPAAAAPPKATPPEPRPPEPKQAAAAPRRRAAPAMPEDAAAAIFADRPAATADGGRGKVPRIPVLRRTPPGVAPAPHAASAPARPAGAPREPRRAGTPALAGPPAAPTAPAFPAAAPPPRLTGAVSGLLRDGNGGSLNGVPVVALSATGGDAFETVTDDEGFYLLSGMKAGRYLLFGALGTRRAPGLAARAVEVQEGKVARVDLREPPAGATVRVRPVGADGAPLAGQALLVAGLRGGAAAFPALLAADAIHAPEPGSRDLFRRVPPGVYSLVLLQGADAPPRVATLSVAVRGPAEQSLEVRFPADVAAGPAGR